MAGQADLRTRRREYDGGPLRRTDVAGPLEQFAAWLEAAEAGGCWDATSMALATVSADGAPSLRMVLLKHFDAQGFCWYTDYRSPKGVDLTHNSRAALLFYWREWSRQVRITGRVERLSAQASETYFQSRPEDSRFAAAACVQSAPVADRATLERSLLALRKRHPEGDVPRPEQWGGYRLRPQELEFWQGRAGRLHDRLVYRSNGEGGWVVGRLQP